MIGAFLAKDGFFRRFSEAKSHDAGEFWLCDFQAVLISNGLKIICKAYGRIYTPRGYRGEGYLISAKIMIDDFPRQA
jgi:hypothetical protein